MRLSLLGLAFVVMAGSADAAPQPDLWSRFREAHPYHIQALALSPPDGSGQRTLIVSEPPPATTLTHLAETYGSQFVDLAVRKHPIGYDGWVKDVVATLPPMADEDLNALLQDLSRDLYGTSYKTYTVPIEATAASVPEGSLNISISSDELRSWVGLDPPVPRPSSWLMPWCWLLSLVFGIAFFRRRRLRRLVGAVILGGAAWWLGTPISNRADAGSFTPLHGGPARAMADVLRGQPGVFLSETPGLVALLLPRHTAINGYATAIREFTLDSDLILGAVSYGGNVAIIGRERTVALDALPPLRTETVLQLAAAKTSELAQSYERTSLFAGRFDDERNRDWAPIYLSDELQDSEYGSLLNITDQMLKSWSQHGEVEYISFGYPKPSSFPFPVALSEYVKADEVTFNWNTKGVGYIDSANHLDVDALSHTGALPVDYLGERNASLHDAEDTAYTYFARLGNPDLARVVQYATIYQICRHFDLTATYDWSGRRRPGADALRGLATTFVHSVLHLPASMLTAGDEEDGPEAVEALRTFATIHEDLREYVAADGQAGVSAIVNAIVAPRSLGSGDGIDERARHAFALAMALQRSPVSRALVSDAVPLARMLYSSADGNGDPTGWIKTPSIVVSWPTGSHAAEVVGGHNLNSAVTRFERDLTVAPGTVRVSVEGDQRTVHYASADGSKINEIVRTAARDADASPDKVESALRDALPKVKAEVRAMPAALPRPPMSRGLDKSMTSNLVNGRTWSLGRAVPASHSATLQRLADASVIPIVVERQHGRFVVSASARAQSIESDSAASAVDSIAALIAEQGPSRQVHLHFEGMDPDQARLFARNIELQSPNRNPWLRTSISSGDERTVQAIAELKKRRWRTQTLQLERSNAIGTVRSDLDVIVTEQAAGGLRLRVKLVFSKAIEVTEAAWAQIQQVVTSWIQLMASSQENLDVLLATRRLMEDLRRIDPSITGVHAQILGQVGEVQVVRSQAAGHGHPAGD